MVHFVLERRIRHGGHLVAALIIAIGSLGCDSDPTEPGGGIILSVSPSSATIPQGGSATVTGTLTRSGAFTGNVNITVSGAPAGVTAVPGNVTTVGRVTTATFTVQVAAATVPGVYNLLVRGQGSGVDDATATFALTVTEASAFTLSLSSTAITIAPAGSAPVAVNIGRTNFTNAVTLALEGAPAGVSGVFNPTPATGASSTLTISVGAAVPAGTYPLVVRASASGLPDQTATITLTVSTVNSYSLSIVPAALTVVQGTSGTATINIARSFADAITLSLGNAPTGVTGSFNPSAATGTTSTLTVTVAAGVAPGVYLLTVDGTAAAGNRSTALTLTVATASGSSNVSLSFASCAGTDRPVWLAFQDGNGPWIRVTGTNDVYSLSITSGRGGVAYVTLSAGGNSQVKVRYASLGEFSGNLSLCPATQNVNAISGTAAGIDATQVARISLGGGSAPPVTLASLPNFQIGGVRNGTHDLVGYRSALTGAGGSDRGIIRRDLNVSPGGSVGAPLDFNGAESFAAATASITVGGAVAGETLIHGMRYQVGATCEMAPLYSDSQGASTFTAFGIPVARQRAGDFHGISVFAQTGSTFRSVTEYFHTLAPRAVTLGAQVNIPTITSLGGPYKRLQAVYTLPADYNIATEFEYHSSVGKSASIGATVGYLGGSSVTLGLPDFSALSGWDNNWPPDSGSAVDWTAGSFGSNFTSSVCTEGARERIAAVSGTF